MNTNTLCGVPRHPTLSLMHEYHHRHQAIFAQASLSMLAVEQHMNAQVWIAHSLSYAEVSRHPQGSSRLAGSESVACVPSLHNQHERLSPFSLPVEYQLAQQHYSVSSTPKWPKHESMGHMYLQSNPIHLIYLEERKRGLHFLKQRSLT